MQESIAVNQLALGGPSEIAPAWVSDAVFYQIFPDRFAIGSGTRLAEGLEPWGDPPTSRSFYGGNLKGIADRLDYLQSLGITALYLTPIFTAPSNHKYDTADYRLIDPGFGDKETFAWLVKCVHARGMRIILDGVFNHTGRNFFAFRDLCQHQERSRYKDWYYIHDFPVGPASKPNYECWWGLGALPRLNVMHPEVHQYLFDVTRYWMQFGIDGWRLDVPNEIPPEFWIQWRRLVKSLNPRAYIVGEIWDDAMPWLQGNQFDGVMNYVLRDACVAFFAGRSMTASAFEQILSRQRARYPHRSSYGLLNLLGSHDTERFLTLCQGDTKRLHLATLFQMTYPGAPMVYYGDEKELQGGKDPGCRGTMPWETASNAGATLRYFRDAIHLRHAHPVFRTGALLPLMSDDRRGLLVFERSNADATALVLLHNGKGVVHVDLRSFGLGGPWEQLWPLADCDQHAVDRSPVLVGEMEGKVLLRRTHE